MISTMDGFSGYNKIKVFPKDQEKTAFTTQWGKVFFKDSNIILKYSILGNCFGLKKTCLKIGR